MGNLEIGPIVCGCFENPICLGERIHRSFTYMQRRHPMHHAGSVLTAQVGLSRAISIHNPPPLSPPSSVPLVRP
jgi:hypothetical protein